MAERIQLRRGLASTWTSVNPVLAQGEIGIELDTYKFKWGDGVVAWNSLSYFGGGISIGDVTGLTAALAAKVDDSQITAFMLTLLDDPDAATARATLGLENVNNTSDANKPVSTATQTALDLKANNPYFHNQSVASNTWVVNHNLGYRPTLVAFMDAGGSEFFATADHTSLNQFTVNLARSITGSVRAI
jgi:hypothetical protein